jgi:organic radical activating enzyme
MSMLKADYGDLAYKRRPMIVITGGEPCIQPTFNKLVQTLTGTHYYVAVESNGTQWREGLLYADWVVVSPKDMVAHAREDVHPTLDERVKGVVNEYRYVITGPQDPHPPFYPANQHYVSPALQADGKGLEAQMGYTPNFVMGAVERCVMIVKEDPRWRISLQTHKWLRIR